MPSHAADELARRAALLRYQGRASSIRDAIRVVGGGADVSPGLVRRHLAAMAESNLGLEEADRQRSAMLETALQLMHAIDDHLARFVDRYPDARGTRLAGRAAAGLLDGDSVLHLRVLASLSDTELAAVVVEAGTEEPTFDVMTSRHGKLRRLRTRLEGLDVHLVICPPESVPGDEPLNLVRGEPISLVDTDGVTTMRDRMLGTDRS